MIKKNISSRRLSGQVFAVALWIMVILSILALAAGHRVSSVLQRSAYHRDKLKSRLLAKAALTKAEAELLLDPSVDYDSLVDNWVNNEEAFKTINLDEGSADYGSVYYVTLENLVEEKRFGLIDEERKINLNTASQALLEELLTQRAVSASQELAKQILVWRGELPNPEHNYEELGYECKGKPFESIPELLFVKEMSEEDYEKVKDAITIYGEGKLNINTISEQTLSLLCRSGAKTLSLKSGVAEGLCGKIVDSRSRKGYFKSIEEIQELPLDTQETNLLNGILPQVVLESACFSILAEGHTKKAQTYVSAVFDRKKKKILSWHEY